MYIIDLISQGDRLVSSRGVCQTDVFLSVCDGITVDVLLRHTLRADDAPSLATGNIYVIPWWGIRRNTHAQCALPSYSAPLALDCEEAVRVRCANDADANKESLFVASESLPICPRFTVASACLRFFSCAA